jgi:hypothetical protein
MILMDFMAIRNAQAVQSSLLVPPPLDIVLSVEKASL